MPIAETINDIDAASMQLGVIFRFFTSEALLKLDLVNLEIGAGHCHCLLVKWEIREFYQNVF